MSLIIDLIIILAAVAAVYNGISKGFIKSVMHFASLIIALICVFTFTGPLATWLGDTFIDGNVSDITENSLNAIVTAGTEHLSIDQILSDRPDALTEVASRFSCDLDELAGYYNEFLSGLADGDAIDALSKKIAAPTADAISTVAAATIVFITALLICGLITYILDLICRLPVLKQLNTFLGSLFGIGSAVVTSWVIANLSVGLISALESIRGDIFNESVITGSIILKFFFDNSLIFF